MRSDHLQVDRGRGGKHLLHLLGREPPERSEQSAQDGPVLVEDRVVAILEEIFARDSRLLARDASTVEAPAENPIDRAVTVVGALVAVLPEGAAEFGD